MSKPSGKPFVATFQFSKGDILAWGKTRKEIAALIEAGDPLLDRKSAAALLRGDLKLPPPGPPKVAQKGTRVQAIKAAYKAMGRATSRDQRILDLAAQFDVDVTTILNALARSNRI